jgi:hypothetical protein
MTITLEDTFQEASTYLPVNLAVEFLPSSMN